MYANLNIIETAILTNKMEQKKLSSNQIKELASKIPLEDSNVFETESHVIVIQDSKLSIFDKKELENFDNPDIDDHNFENKESSPFQERMLELAILSKLKEPFDFFKIRWRENATLFDFNGEILWFEFELNDQMIRCGMDINYNNKFFWNTREEFYLNQDIDDDEYDDLLPIEFGQEFRYEFKPSYLNKKIIQPFLVNKPLSQIKKLSKLYDNFDNSLIESIEFDEITDQYDQKTVLDASKASWQFNNPKWKFYENSLFTLAGDSYYDFSLCVKPTYNEINDPKWDYKKDGLQQHQKDIISIEMIKKCHLIAPNDEIITSYESINDNLHYEEKTGIWWSTHQFKINSTIKINIEIGIGVYSGSCHIKYP